MNAASPPLSAAIFEKLGLFYLGRVVEPTEPEQEGGPLLYDARDLTTHAVAVGMTGSGKTGLCVTLLEEAALDGIPAIAIDPKGDLGNLLLTFPELRPSDFRPWIDESEAARRELEPDELAERTAAKWREGLAAWGQDGERIRALRGAADFCLYTPGGSHGVPLAVLRSFAAPAAALLEDRDALQERIDSAVSGLLALIGEEADPLKSREHILLARILQEAWGQGRDLDLAALIHAVQSPPFERVGVLDLESFFPADDRFALAMQLNNIIASPGFETWRTGQPLEIPSLLWTPEGRPRISILSIAHLEEAERMFFVTLLLNELVAWVRTQPGTSSLRAILYMDEIFGYVPPTRMPPSKRPMLTLLKQARAYGLGVVLATQNPVDLDYKGLSNAGTWFLGRLQTERDKQRVLDGLEAASAAPALDRKTVERTLSGLESRTFLLNNVHEEGPALFRTRWAMSYLRGPLARPEIERLTADRRESAAAMPEAKPRAAPAAAAGPGASVPAPPVPEADAGRPVLPPGVPEVFLSAIREGGGRRLLYRPALLGEADLHYARASFDLDEWQAVACLAALDAEATVPWADATVLESPAADLAEGPAQGAAFASLPGDAVKPAIVKRWETTLKTHLYRNVPLVLYRSRSLKLTSAPGESEAEFRIRVRQRAREVRDEQMDKLRERYGKKIQRLEEKVRKARERQDRERDQYSQQKMQTAISVGATVLGALLGRKTISARGLGRATTAARGVGRASREREDVARAGRDVEAYTSELESLEAELAEKAGQLRDELAPEAVEIESVELRPRKTDTAVRRVALAWSPWWIDPQGIAEPGWM